MDQLDRLFRRLVHNVRTHYPDYLARPFEVAELYQTLIPYRHNRSALQIETNQDYELALTALLAGERGYLIGDPAMQEELQRELASANPDLSAFRRFSASHVSLASEAVRQLDAAAPEQPMPPRTVDAAWGGASARPTPVAAPAAPVAPAAPAAPAAAPSRPQPSPVASSPSLPAPMANAPRTTTASALGGRCRYCGGALPEGRRITYCPHCGQNLTVVHCPACGTELETGWKFCTTCGRGVGTPA